MDKKDRGLFEKYRVIRIDGKDIYPTDKHYDCRLFVLDITHDEHARVAALAYSNSCRDEYPLLADDLVKEVEDAVNALSKDNS
jgi:hypothetical protein